MYLFYVALPEKGEVVIIQAFRYNPHLIGYRMEEYVKNVLADYKELTETKDVTLADVEIDSPLPIERHHYTKSAALFYSRDKKEHAICLKLPLYNEVYKQRDIIERNTNIIQGIRFNRNCASSVYLGVAKITSRNKYFLNVNEITEFPSLDNIHLDEEHVIVMKSLPQLARLDYWFKYWFHNDFAAIEYLADEVSKFHTTCTEQSPQDYGTFENISTKLAYNIRRFDEALQLLPMLAGISADKYRFLSSFLKRSLDKNKAVFQMRHKNGKIKRFHGDIKVKNIFIIPEIPFALGRKNYPAMTHIIDSIDFNPDFYYIDSLSDMAMLAASIYAYFSEESSETRMLQCTHGIGYAIEFIKKYLAYQGEDFKEVIPLVEYYMLEKLMTIAYVNIFHEFNKQKIIKYLDCALSYSLHMENLDYTNL